VRAPRETIRLPFALSTAGIARTKLAGFLTVQRVDPAVMDDALIVLGEMLANALCHGVPTSDDTIEITWAINGDLLELSVYDAGEGASLKPVDFDEDSLSGRGLAIISRVADRWWVDMDKGTRVSAELSGLLAHHA
jgi:serine/threonine-protein kinase RsbW